MNEHAEQSQCPACDQQIRELERRVAETEGLERAEALMNLADAAYFDSRWELALAAISACRDLLPEGEFPRLEADCERKTSCALAELERYEEALERVQKAHALYSNLQESNGVACCMRMEGRLLLQVGRSDDGIAILSAACQEFRNLGRLEDVAECELDIGKELVKCHSYRAIEHLENAHAAFAACGYALMVATCEMQAGMYFAHQRNMEPEALERLVHAALIFKASAGWLEAAQCEDEAGWMLSKLHRPKEAIDLHKEALPVLSDLGSPREIAQCQVRWGYALKDLRRPKQAAAKLRAALKGFRKLGAEAEIEAAGCEDYLGMTLQAQGEYLKAAEHHRNAMKIFDQHGMTRDAEMCEYYLEVAVKQANGETLSEGEEEILAPVIPIRKGRKRRS